MDINQIKGYFGTELRMAVINDYNNGNGFVTLFGSHTDLDLRCLSVQLINCRPILHPLSDLTEPCLEGGKVPIVELAKRCFAASSFGEDLEYSNINSSHDRASVDAYCSSVMDNGLIAKFSYIKFSQQFTLSFGEREDFIIPQLALFEMMYSMHMDLHGLIDKGDAIDINKLY